jgi:hypothetical protein
MELHRRARRSDLRQAFRAVMRLRLDHVSVVRSDESGEQLLIDRR